MVATTAMKVIAEFFGTFLLMVSILASGGNFLVIGLTLAFIIFVIGGISSAAVNPAVSLGLWFSGSLDTTTLVLYSIAQLLGGIAASYSYAIVA